MRKTVEAFAVAAVILVLVSACQKTDREKSSNASQKNELTPRFPLGLNPEQTPKEVTAHLNAMRGLKMFGPISDNPPNSPGHAQGLWNLNGQIVFDKFIPRFLGIRFYSPTPKEKERFHGADLVQINIESCSSVEGVYHDAVKFVQSNYNFDGAEIVDSEKVAPATCLDYAEYGRAAWSAKTEKWWIVVTSRQDHDATYSVEVEYNYRPVSDMKIQAVHDEDAKAKATTKTNL